MVLARSIDQNLNLSSPVVNLKGVDVKQNQCFLLSTSAVGVRFEEGKAASTVFIPRDSLVQIVSGIENPQKMIEVDWRGRRVMVFVQDIRERGTLVSGSHAPKA